MSSSGPFKLVMNEGKQDKLIYATELLMDRIRDISCQRAKRGFEDTMPTLVDIERTHILYMNSHYRPHAAIGYEYVQTPVQGGQPMFGGTIMFNIPNYGDFISDMALALSIEETQATVGTVPSFPDFIGPDDQLSTSTKSVSARQDTVTGVYTTYTYEYVDFNGAVQAVGAPAQNFVRYCEFPGVRIVEQVKFDVNGNQLALYNHYSTLMYQNFKLQPHKLTGWKRLVGQEVPVEAYTNFISVAGATNYPAAAANLTTTAGTPVGTAPVNATRSTRKLVQIVHGPQTPARVQPQLDLIIPLLFWFCLDFHVSIPSVCIPYGQRLITYNLAAQKDILSVAPGNLYLRLTTERSVSAGTNKGTAAAVDVTSCDTTVTRKPVLAVGSVINSAQRILSANLLNNQMFVNTEIHDIYVSRLAFTLVRLQCIQTNVSSDAEARIHLSGIKWPVESMSIGVRPRENIADSNPNRGRDWHKLSYVSEEAYDIVANSTARMSVDPSQPWNTAFTRAAHCHNSSETIIAPFYTKSVLNLYIEAHNVRLYQSAETKFYNAYLPFVYGGRHLKTPDDIGALLINFCLYNGKYNPSGHLNMSRAREVYAGYTSNVPSGRNASLELIVVADCINFLLVTDGSAVIRFNT